MRKRILWLVLSVMSLTVTFTACRKDRGELCSISVTASSMVGTPAEAFSLQHIRMFQASNSFVCSVLGDIAEGKSFSASGFSPLFMLNSMGEDTAFDSWLTYYNKYYSLTEYSKEESGKSFHSFLTVMQEIDSTIKIESHVDSIGKDRLFISQDLSLQLLYSDEAEQKKDMISIYGTFPYYVSNDEEVIEVPVGNGNYSFMLIQPTMPLKEYVMSFSEEKYSDIIKSLEARNMRLSFPLFAYEKRNVDITLPQLFAGEPESAAEKAVSIKTTFSISQATKADIAVQKPASGDRMQTNNVVRPVSFDRPFLYILRGKASNLILFVGFYM